MVESGAPVTILRMEIDSQIKYGERTMKDNFLGEERIVEVVRKLEENLAFVGA